MAHRNNETSGANADDIVSFLQLYDRPFHHLVLINAGKIRARSFRDPKAAARYAVAGNERHFNCYWSLNECNRPINRKAKESDIARIHGGHVDVDVRHRPDLMPDAYGDLLRSTYEELTCFETTPSILLFSGGGYQCIWLYEQPLEVESEDDILAQKARNRWLQERMKKLLANEAAKVDHVQNIDRVLRLPGTVNWLDPKKARSGRKPMLARLLHPNAGVLQYYQPGDFGEIHEQPKRRKPNGKANFDIPEEGINLSAAGVPESLHRLIRVDGDKGDRSAKVFKVACELVRAGLPDETIGQILLTPGFAISAHVYEQADPQRCIARVLAKAHESKSRPPKQSGAEDASLLQAHWTVDPWPEPVNGAELLNHIVAVLKRHMILPSHADIALALWALYTWVFDAFEHAPYLAIVSPTPECGKTTLLIILKLLTCRSMLASNISPAGIYRFVDEHSPTLLIDEGRTFLNNDDPIIGILNSGHSKESAAVIRMDGESKNMKAVEFSTWGPKCIATIGKLNVQLESRSIKVTLQRKARDERTEKFRRRQYDAELAIIRRRALRWANGNMPALERSEPDIPEEIYGRGEDVWTPLFALADLAGADWPKLAREAAIALLKKTDSKDRNVQLLEHIRDVYAEHNMERLTPTELVRDLLNLEESPWLEFKRGKALNTTSLARELKEFEIASKHQKAERFYYKKDFKKAWKRYLPATAKKAQNP